MKFSSEALEEHVEVPVADGGRWEDVIAEFDRRHATAAPRSADERSAVYVVCVGVGRRAEIGRGQRDEIVSLVRAQGDAVVGDERLRVIEANPRTLLGRGACEAVSKRARALGADTVVLDAELSPSQMRNLEDALGMPVRDRESVILNVFLRHARTRRARIQIEVAQLEYLRPRIRGLGLQMDQQAGGLMKARGPGETASELLARRLDGRLVELRRALKKLQRSALEQRRGRTGAKSVALVGYTNAGKTSLMNALTRAELSARNVPFETLDVTSRSLTRRGGDVVLSDTVGFIRHLPERLMASFESTLAEVTRADLLVIVIDASDPEWDLHLDTCEEVLARLDAGDIPRFYVFNKADKRSALTPRQAENLSAEHGYVSLCSHDAGAIAALKRTLIRRVQTAKESEIYVAYENNVALTAVYKRCRVLRADAKPSGLLFTVQAEPAVIREVRALSQEPKKRRIP
ncbi:MAG: GTP-binding protein HflX [Polyangiales bacterium]|jgi:GTP-binding protein HflX